MPTVDFVSLQQARGVSGGGKPAVVVAEAAGAGWIADCFDLSRAVVVETMTDSRDGERAGGNGRPNGGGEIFGSVCGVIERQRSAPRE